MSNNKTNNNFLIGFLLGALIGAVLVFLLGTKKGKRILKAITEEKLDNLSDILDKVGETTDLEEADEELPLIKQSVKVKPVPQEVESNFVFKERPPEEKPRVRRFFRGIHRHLN